MTLTQMSFMGAVMILAIGIIRMIAINKLPKKVFLLLWEIVMVRLSIPFYIPLGASIYNIFRHGEDLTVKYSSNTTINFPTAVTNDLTAAAAEMTPKSDPVLVWFIIWIIGFILCLLGFSALYAICYKKFRYSEKINSDIAAKLIKDMNIKRKIRICLSDNISSPLTYGIIKPVILLPKNIYTGEYKQLDYVFRHELIHIKRLDIVRKMIMTTVLCIHWFNPFVWIMYLLYNRDIELVCDEAVIRSESKDCRSVYAMALIDMEEKTCGLTSLYSNFSKNSIEERIAAIMKTKKINFVTGIMACTVILGVTSVFATSANTESIKDVLSLEETEVINSPDIEWWTYDEYKKWLENEKKELQSVLGSRAWTSVDGHFIWTQEKIDETIAMYEETLQQIKDGAKISKPMADGTIITQSQPRSSKQPSERDKTNAANIANSKRFREYEKYGLKFDSKNKVLMFEGEWVGYFKDEYSPDAYTRCLFDSGKIGVVVVRDSNYNIKGLKKTDIPVSSADAVAIEVNDVYALDEGPFSKYSTESISKEELFSKYSAYGISFNKAGEMLYKGETVRLFCDGVEIDNGFASRYTYLNEKGTVDVFTKYERTDNGDGSFDPFGKFLGLKKSSPEEFDQRDISLYSSSSETAYTEEAAADSSAVASDVKGETISEKFLKYKRYGIEYREKKPGSGAGNVYYNGETVKKFADISPNGSAFTYTSKDGGKINVYALYDNNGVLCGVKKIS